MYLTAVNSGVRFPPPTRSQYSHLEKVEIPQASLDAYSGGGGIWDNQFRQPQEQYNNNGYNSGSPFGGASSSGNPFGQPAKQKSPAIQKLENDLDLFQQKIADTEARIRRGDNSRQMQEQIQALREFEPKLVDLPIKLKAAGEYETADFAVSVLQKLQACNDLLNRGPGQSAPQPGSGFGGFDFGVPAAPQGAVDFDAFNRAGGEKSFSNNSSGGLDFGTQPKPAQGSSNIWDSGFMGQSDASGSRTQGGSFGQPANPGNGFFGVRQHASSPFDSTPPKQSQASIEIDLLGIEETKPKPTPVAATPNLAAGGAGFDLLGGGPIQQKPLGVTPQASNPFLSNNLLGAAPQQGLLGQPSQVPAGVDPAQLRLMQINMMGNPLQTNPMIAGAAINPLLYQLENSRIPNLSNFDEFRYQQMLLASQGLIGVPPQVGLVGGQTLGLGAQVPLGTPQTLGGIQAGLGGATAPTFGVNNTVSFTADNKVAQNKPSSRDPFSDLTSDLI